MTTEQFVAIKATLATAIAALLGFWAHSVPVMVSIMLGAMMLDFFTGVLASGYEKSIDPTKLGINSKTGKSGMYKKLMQVCVVVFAALFAPALGNPTILGMTFPEWSAGFIAGLEGISIMENIQRAGVRIPSFLSRALEGFANQANDPGESTKPHNPF